MEVEPQVSFKHYAFCEYKPLPYEKQIYLFHLARDGFDQIAREILHEHVVYHNIYKNMLDIAVQYKRMNIIAMIIDEYGFYNIPFFNKLVINSVVYQNFEALKYLISKGATIHKTDEVFYQLYTSDIPIEIIDFLIENGADVVTSNTALYTCVKSNRQHIVRHLLTEYKVDPNMNDGEVLQLSCEEGNLTMVRMLLQNGANVKVRRNYCLRIAIQNGNEQLVKLLVSYKAPIILYRDCLSQYFADKDIDEIMNIYYVQIRKY